MTPAKQSKLWTADGIHNGNCFAACLASLLDLPLWMVPPFEDMFARPEWRARVNQWLARAHSMQLRRTEGHQFERLPEFYMANGMSPRGVMHSVIYGRGTLVHDPHPSGAGVATVEYTWHLEPGAAEIGDIDD